MATKIVTPPQVATPVFVAAPVNHIRIAQLLADEEYDWFIEHGLGGELAARGYHVCYQRYVRAHLAEGAGPLCGCDLCRDELGGAQ